MTFMDVITGKIIASGMEFRGNDGNVDIPLFHYKRWLVVTCPVLCS